MPLNLTMNELQDYLDWLENLGIDFEVDLNLDTNRATITTKFSEYIGPIFSERIHLNGRKFKEVVY